MSSYGMGSIQWRRSIIGTSRCRSSCRATAGSRHRQPQPSLDTPPPALRGLAIESGKHTKSTLSLHPFATLPIVHTCHTANCAHLARALSLHPFATLPICHVTLPIVHTSILYKTSITGFDSFSRRHWITLNQPATQAIEGYAKGTHAPGKLLSLFPHLKPDGAFPHMFS